MAPRLTKVFIILRSIKCIPEFVVNSYLYLHSGSVAMRQLNPMHEKGPWNLKFFESIDRISAFKLFNIDESYTECGNWYVALLFWNLCALCWSYECGVTFISCYLHSYLVIYQSTCYFQLLFGCHYSIGSSVEYQGSVLFQQYTFNTVFVALAPQQNW